MGFWEKVGYVLMMVFLIWFASIYITSCFRTVDTVRDSLQHGLRPLRKGYIPPSKRIHPDKMFVPPGADPKDYIKD